MAESVTPTIRVAATVVAGISGGTALLLFGLYVLCVFKSAPTMYQLTTGIPVPILLLTCLGSAIVAISSAIIENDKQANPNKNKPTIALDEGCPVNLSLPFIQGNCTTKSTVNIEPKATKEPIKDYWKRVNSKCQPECDKLTAVSGGITFTSIGTESLNNGASHCVCKPGK